MGIVYVYGSMLMYIEKYHLIHNIALRNIFPLFLKCNKKGMIIDSSKKDDYLFEDYLPMLIAIQILKYIFLI